MKMSGLVTENYNEIIIIYINFVLKIEENI